MLDILKQSISETAADMPKVLQLKQYYIWSNEHNAWWGVNHQGYVHNLSFAGLYTEEEAIKICNGANWNWDMDTNNKPNELPIAQGIAEQLTQKGN